MSMLIYYICCVVAYAIPKLDDGTTSCHFFAHTKCYAKKKHVPKRCTQPQCNIDVPNSVT